MLNGSRNSNTPDDALASITVFFKQFRKQSTRRGMNWHPLTKDEIRSAEKKWHLTFPPVYHAFLEHLGSTAINGNPGFYDWRRDDEAIQRALDWPLEGLLFDVEENELWMPSWGPRPDSSAQRTSVLKTLVAAAPTLIPIYGHRYLLHTPTCSPVLSVYQSDIIIYGGDMALYLMSELASLNLKIEWKTLTQLPSVPPVPASGFWGELIG